MLTIVAFIRLFCTQLIYIVFVQCTEIFPTPIRSTGFAWMIVFGLGAMISTPYVLHVWFCFFILWFLCAGLVNWNNLEQILFIYDLNHADIRSCFQESVQKEKWINSTIFLSQSGFGEAFPYWLLVVLMTICAFLGIYLPETIGLPLPQTFQDAEELGRGRPLTTWINHWNQHKYIAVSTEDPKHVELKRRTWGRELRVLWSEAELHLAIISTRTQSEKLRIVILEFRDQSSLWEWET